MGNLNPETVSRDAIFRMTVDLTQIWRVGETSFIFCILNMKREVMAFPWTLPFGLIAWNFVQPGLCFSDCLWSGRGSCCEGSGPVRAAEAPNGERSKELGWWKGPLRPSPCYQWPSLENTFLLPLTPAAFFGAHPSAAPSSGQIFLFIPQALLPITDHFMCK